MYSISERDMHIIVNGASFLASGGGGAVAMAKDVIANVVAFSPSVQVATLAEVADDQGLLVICGVGAPDAPNPDFKNSPGYGLQGLQQMSGRRFHYVLPIEVGAMNSMIPLLACAQLGLPFIDGDGAGRSVPQMSMSTYALQGFSTEYTLVVSEADQRYPLHPRDANAMEAQVRDIVSTRLANAGTVAAWPLTGAQARSEHAVVGGSLTLARSVGEAMAGANPLASVAAVIAGFYPAHGVIMRNGRVTAATNVVKDGFDVGVITVDDEAGMTVRLYFVNETLLATIDRDGSPLAFMLGPDLIGSMGVDGSPMTNSEIYNRFVSGDTVRVALMWVQALEAIRTPIMFFKYLTLLQEKFDTAPMAGYRFIDDAMELFDR
ncbi:MAG: DUF917 family protein [Pseudomonadota bacterium]|nr:DUF917 family protein [Pseudomonadota bacterium]